MAERFSRTSPTLSRPLPLQFRALAAVLVLVSAIVLYASPAPAQDGEWNGYTYQNFFRLNGNNAVNYWYDGSVYPKSYNQAMDSAIDAWFHPRVNGDYQWNGAARCPRPTNQFGYAYTGADNHWSEMDVYVKPFAYPYQGYWALTHHRLWGNVYVDPDEQGYDYAIFEFNTGIMNAKPLWDGKHSKRAVASHELGHVLGLEETQMKGTVMAQYDVRDVVGPTCRDDRSALVRWY